MNLCEANHEKHDHITVNTDVGPMVVYDWEKYMGYKGYCTGQDDVSMTLDKYGTWDKPIKDLIERLSYGGYGKGIFIDVGSHVGYFSNLAQKYGFKKIMSYEAETESLNMTRINAPQAEIHGIWFDQNTKPYYFEDDVDKVDIMKIDIEGSEQYAIRYFSELINSRKVQNIIMEISPTFNDSYPQLLKLLRDVGYKIFELDGSWFDWNFNFEQKNLWLQL